MARITLLSFTLPPLKRASVFAGMARIHTARAVQIDSFIICFAEHIELIIKRPSETFQTAFSVESAIKTADFQIKLRCRNRCGGAGHPGLVRGRGRL